MFFRGVGPRIAAAALALAGALASGCGEKYHNEAEKQFLKAARKGDAEAQYSLGASYEFGGGAARDVDLAKRWYAKAAAQGHKKAAARLRHLNPPQAPAAEDMKALRAAAKKGDAEALFKVGQCMEFGFHGQKDLDEALRCYSRAAAKGHEEAGKIRERMAEELAPAESEVKNFRIAARKGNAEAQYQFARCLEFGFHVKQSTYDAAEWYKRAARQGHPKAMARLNWKPKTQPRKPAKTRNRKNYR